MLPITPPPIVAEASSCVVDVRNRSRAPLLVRVSDGRTIRIVGWHNLPTATKRMPDGSVVTSGGVTGGRERIRAAIGATFTIADQTGTLDGHCAFPPRERGYGGSVVPAFDLPGVVIDSYDPRPYEQPSH